MNYINYVNPCLEIYRLIEAKDFMHNISKYIYKYYQKYFDNYTKKRYRGKIAKQLYYNVLRWLINGKGNDCGHRFEPIYPLNYKQFEYKYLWDDLQNLVTKPIVEKDKFIKIQKRMRKHVYQKTVRDLSYKDKVQTHNPKIHIKDVDNITYITYHCDKCNYDDIYKKIKCPKQLKEKLAYTIVEKRLDKKYHNSLIFCLLTRYEIYDVEKEGINLSVDSIYFNKKLTSKITLDVEMFSSAANRHLCKIFSLFPDLEYFFGSLGPFNCFNENHPFWTQNKYISANPPYDNLVMTKMAKLIVKIINKFNKENKDICFIITIPDWRPNPNYPEPYECYEIMKPHTHFEIIFTSNFMYFDYFTHKMRKIGRTGTIMLVLKTKGMKISFSKDDLENPDMVHQSKMIEHYKELIDKCNY